MEKSQNMDQIELVFMKGSQNCMGNGERHLIQKERRRYCDKKDIYVFDFPVCFVRMPGSCRDTIGTRYPCPHPDTLLKRYSGSLFFMMDPCTCTSHWL